MLNCFYAIISSLAGIDVGSDEMHSTIELISLAITTMAALSMF